MNAEAIALGWNELAGAIRTKSTLPADQMELLASKDPSFSGISLSLTRPPLIDPSRSHAQWFNLCLVCFSIAVVSLSKSRRCHTVKHNADPHLITLRRAHAPLGLTAGLTSADLHAIRTAPPFSASSTSDNSPLSPLYAALLDYADQMTRHILVPESTFSRLKELLRGDNRKIVEATTTVAGYNFSTRVLRALNVAGLGEVEVPVPELN